MFRRNVPSRNLCGAKCSVAHKMPLRKVCVPRRNIATEHRTEPVWTTRNSSSSGRCIQTTQHGFVVRACVCVYVRGSPEVDLNSTRHDGCEVRSPKNPESTPVTLKPLIPLLLCPTSTTFSICASSMGAGSQKEKQKKRSEEKCRCGSQLPLCRTLAFKKALVTTCVLLQACFILYAFRAPVSAPATQRPLT